MSLDGIVAGDFGQPIELTFIDVDTGLAADISSYSTAIQMIFQKGSATAVEKTATFKTDGTDGVIRYVVEAGLLTAGLWKVRGRVTISTTAKLTTEEIRFNVLS